VGANISDTVPVVGPLMKQVLLGGDTYNDRTLSRFFILHAAVLPVLLIFVLMMHIGLVRLLGVTELKFAGETAAPVKHFNFFPEHFYTELIIGLTLMILLSVLATLVPVEMGPRANPQITPEVIKPEWFFYARPDRVRDVLLAVHRRLAGAAFQICGRERLDWRRGRARHHGTHHVGSARGALRMA